MREPSPTNKWDADKLDIMELVRREIGAWLRRDLQEWSRCWLQNERAQHVNARPSVGARRLQGFDAIYEYFAAAMERLPETLVQPEDVRLEDWRVSLSEDMAWVTFDQVIPLDAPSDAAPGRHNQMRILEKVDGDWRIAAIFHIPNRIGYYETPWVRVDRSGRIIEFGANAEESLSDHKTLKVAGQRLAARRDSDSRKLKGALEEADDFISKRTGRTPTPLILSDTDDLTVSLCWVSIADMMIVILLDDEQLMEKAIGQAGEVYRLSAAQMKVAEAIARGHDLNKAAELLSVTPNTVRTHVRRMFERVGVNSQPALMTALLSVEPPK